MDFAVLIHETDRNTIDSFHFFNKASSESFPAFSFNSATPKMFIKNHVRLIGATAVIAISFLDYLITADLAFSIFYLLPISFVSQYGERWFTIFLVLISTLGWFIAESAAKVDLSFVLVLWNTAVRLMVFLTIALLLLNLKTAYEREKKLSRIDGLTEIANRRHFLELLQIEYKRSLRYEHCFTLAYFDLDNFKQINDRFGHHTGDKLLKIIAQTIKTQIRETDTVARLGGDEFALLLPETDYETARYILNRLQQKLMMAIEAYPVSFSIGAFTFLNLPQSLDSIIAQADRLMYEVKKSGKNRLEHRVFNKV